MGQGIYTGLAMGAAEELMVPWDQVKVEPLDASLSWLSAGSGGISRRLPTFLQAGAAAREMLVAAAAQTWGVDPANCEAVITGGIGSVKKSATGETLSYGSLAPLAATLPVPRPAVAHPAGGLPDHWDGGGAPRSSREDRRQRQVWDRRGGARDGIRDHQARPDDDRHAEEHAAVPPGASAVVPLDNAYALVSWLPGANTWGLIEAAKEIGGNIWNTDPDAALIDSKVFHSQAMHLLGRGTPYIAEQDGRRRCGVRGRRADPRPDLHATVSATRLHGGAELHRAHDTTDGHADGLRGLGPDPGAELASSPPPPT